MVTGEGTLLGMHAVTSWAQLCVAVWVPHLRCSLEGHGVRDATYRAPHRVSLPGPLGHLGFFGECTGPFSSGHPQTGGTEAPGLEDRCSEQVLADLL